MSLVEQAIARLRNQATAAKAKIPETAPTRAAPAIVDLVAEPVPPKRMVLDMDTLRAHGYQPEVGKEQEFADQYRRIKRPLIDTAFSGATAFGEPRVIMITSALSGDGKTFTSINLALSMALERDVSVLLVDCDVAKRHISEVVGLKDEVGLLDALVDESLNIESLVTSTNVRGLSILPAGKRVESAAELLSSNRMRQIIAGLCSRVPGRIVLLDSPPLLITNEGRSMVKLAGQIALVVRVGSTPCQAVKDALELFDAQKAGGIILNEVKIGRSTGYDYGYASYGKGGDAA